MPQRPIGERPFVINLIVIVCNGCQSERKILIDPPFRGAEEFIAWEKKKLVPRCDCGFPTADYKLYIADEN